VAGGKMPLFRRRSTEIGKDEGTRRRRQIATFVLLGNTGTYVVNRCAFTATDLIESIPHARFELHARPSAPDGHVSIAQRADNHRDFLFPLSIPPIAGGCVNIFTKKEGDVNKKYPNITLVLFEFI
jgi:hypothetical protein